MVTIKRDRQKGGLISDPVLANSWPEFLDAVRDARLRLGNPSVAWYRGHSRHGFFLTPSLLRHPLGAEKEQLLFNEYERSASRLHAARSNDWDLLADMQHYGIPTRLLDWTDVLGVAVAFALYSGEDDVDSGIYVLDPLALNRLSGIDEIKRAANDPDFKYKSIYWHGRPFKAVYPIAIDSAFKNDRIAAQNGSFTVHGSEADPLEFQAPNCVQKIHLGPAAKPGARELLEHANLNAFSIYPDIVGMARHIARKHLG